MTKIKTIAVSHTTDESNSTSGGNTITSATLGAFDAISANSLTATTANIDNLKSNQIDTGTVNTTSVNATTVVATNGTYNGLTSKTINSVNIDNSDTINTDKLNARTIDSSTLTADLLFNNKLKSASAEIDNAYIKQLLSDDINVKDLTVTGKAHFFELVIDKIKSAGGSVILTAADGFSIDAFVKSTDNKTITLFWQSENDGSARYNMWAVGDQAICSNFNNAQVGTSYNISNKMYWAAVTAVSGNSPMYGYFDKTNNKLYSDANTHGTSDTTNTFSYNLLFDNTKKSDWTQCDYDVYLSIKPNTAVHDSYWDYYTYDYKFVGEYNNLSATEQANYKLYTAGTAYFMRTENDSYLFTTLNKYNFMGDFSRTDCKRYNWITISTTNCYDKSVFDIAIGDNIAMLGYQGTDDDNRQSAIYMSAYSTLDSNLTPPLIAQYRNINNFDLSSHRKSFFDGKSAEFIGSFKVVSNDAETDLTNYINSQFDVDTSAISAAVKSNTTAITDVSANVRTNTDNIARLVIDSSSISSTVSKHTTYINDVSTRVVDVSSLISQTADNIRLQVMSTGIDLDTSTITLDSDKTIIKGNLQINEKTNGEGLTIFDSDGIPRVELRTGDISDMTAIVDGSTGSMSGSQTIYCAAISHITIEDGLRDYVLQSATQAIGKYNVGDKIDIKKWYITHNSTYNEQLTYTITLQRDNKSATNIVVKSDTIDIVNSYAVITVDDYSYTVTTAGEYNLIFDYKVNLNTYTVDDPVSHVAYMTLTRTSSQIVVIGKDGMAALSDTNKWVYIGRDKTEIRWGVDKGIKFDSSAVWQRHPTTDGLGGWGPIGCYRHIDAVTATDSNNPYYVTDATDTLISTSAAENYIYVPDAQAYNGRVITIIDKNTAELHISFNNKSYISANSNDKVNNQWITMDGNCVRRFTYISGLSAWIEEKMD